MVISVHLDTEALEGCCKDHLSHLNVDWSKSVLSHMVTISHMGLFKFKLIKTNWNYKFSSLVVLPHFQLF